MVLIGWTARVGRLFGGPAVCWLGGVDCGGAECVEADFGGAIVAGPDFDGAEFDEADCGGATVGGPDCDAANCDEAHCGGATAAGPNHLLEAP